MEKSNNKKIVYSPDFTFSKYSTYQQYEISDHYRSYYTKEIILNDIIRKQYIRDSDFKCSFCGSEKNDNVKFNEEKHVIPALFNNPKLLTKEECDQCNHKFGDLYESNLAEILNPLLVTSNILGRNSKKTIKSLQTKEKVTLRKNEGLTFYTDHKAIFNKKDGTITVKVPQKPFSPKYAIKSFLHMIWLILNEESRKEYAWIKEKLINPESDICLGLYHGYFFRNTHSIKLDVFERKSNEKGLCKLFFTLFYGHNFIIYGLNESEFKPVIIPDFVSEISSSSFPTCSLTFLESDFIHNKEQKITFNFESYSENDISKKKEIEKVNDVIISLNQNGIEILNKTIFKIYKNLDVIIEGGDLCGRFSFNLNDSDKIFFEELLDQQSIHIVYKTIKFLEAIDINSTISLMTYSGDKLGDFKPGGIKFQNSMNSIVHKLYFISNQINSEIKFRTKIYDEEINFINLVYNVLKNGETILSNKMFVVFENNEKYHNFYNSLLSEINNNVIYDYPVEYNKILDSRINMRALFYIKMIKIKKIELVEHEMKIVIESKQISLIKKNAI